MKRGQSTLRGRPPRLNPCDRRNGWILVLLSLLAYAPSLWGVLHGSWPFDDDAPALIGPWREWARDSLWDGVLPLWNPHLFCGLPFMANGQTAVLYPPNLVYWLVPLHWALWLDAFAHNILFACGGYLLAREMQCSRTASMLAAVCFALGGSISGHIFTGHMTWHAARAWLPWQGWALLRYGRRAEVKWLIWLAIFFAVQVAAGYPPLVLMGAGLCSGLFIARSASRWLQQRAQSTLSAAWPRPWWLHAAGVMVLAAMLSAVWILPLRETSALSVHGSGLSYEDAARLSGSWKSLVRLLLPNFFNGNQDMQWSLIYGAHEEAAYIGLLPLLLAFSAPLLSRRERHPALWWLWLAMWPVLLLALGDNTLLYHWLFDHVAPFRLLRNPVRWLEAWFFVASLLSACTFDSVFKKRERRNFCSEPYAPVRLAQHACVVVAGVSTALLVWLWKVPATSEFWLEILRQHPGGGNAADPGAVARVFWNAALSQSIDTLFVALAVWLVLHISKRNAASRTALWLVAITGAELLALFWSCSKIPSPAHATQWVMWPKVLSDRYQPDQRWDTGTDWHAINQALPLGIDVFNGYDAMSSKAYFDFARVLEGKDSWRDMYQPLRRTTLLRVAGVTHSLVNIRTRDADRTVFPAGADGWMPQLVAQSGAWKLWRHRGAWPRIYGARRLLRAPAAQQLPLLERLSRAPEFAAATVVAPDAFRALPAAPSAIKVLWSSHTTNLVTLRTQSDGNGVVVIGDAWFPGWHAFVNGREVPIEHSNYLFRAVEVPRGTSQVTMVYAPQSFRLGAFLSLCALAFVAAYVTTKVLWRAPHMKMRDANSGLPIASTRTR